MENGKAEQASSICASPCLLADKADGSDRFCTDFRKVNAVTEPDCAVLHMKYFIDWVGSEKFVMRLDL